MTEKGVSSVRVFVYLEGVYTVPGGLRACGAGAFARHGATQPFVSLLLGGSAAAAAGPSVRSETCDVRRKRTGRRARRAWCVESPGGAGVGTSLDETSPVVGHFQFDISRILNGQERNNLGFPG